MTQFFKNLGELFKRLFARFRKPAQVLPFPTPQTPLPKPILAWLKPYKWACREINQAEITGVQNNPRIIFYHSFTALKGTTDEIPWCSAFICAAAESSGFKSTKSAAASSWLTYGVEGDGAVGDIVVLSRGNAHHHVGFLDQPYKPGDEFLTLLGGNQDNRVCVKKFRVEKLLAIRRFV